MIISSGLVGVIDYGAGNVSSVVHSLRRLGIRAVASSKCDALKECDALIVPGVGAFPWAMATLKDKGLDLLICEMAASKRPVLGICLGMQLLCEASSELGSTKGLGLIPGEVCRLSGGDWHIGWNNIIPTSTESILTTPWGASMYFNHSYEYKGDKHFVEAYARLGNRDVVAAIRNGNVWGLQFHPEKSQSAGLALLAKLIKTGDPA